MTRFVFIPYVCGVLLLYCTEEIGSYLRSELNSIEKFDIFLTFDVPRSGKDGHFHIHGRYSWTSIWTRV